MVTKMDHSNANDAHVISRIVTFSCQSFIKVRSKRVEMGDPKVASF